jgi:hypothetical protein
MLFSSFPHKPVFNPLPQKISFPHIKKAPQKFAGLLFVIIRK